MQKYDRYSRLVYLPSTWLMILALSLNISNYLICLLTDLFSDTCDILDKVAQEQDTWYSQLGGFSMNNMILLTRLSYDWC